MPSETMPKIDWLTQPSAALIIASRPWSFFDLCMGTELNVIGAQTDSTIWITKGPLHSLTQQVRGIGERPWALLCQLLQVKDFVVEDPLRDLIDQGFSFTGFFQALWEARFLFTESNPQSQDLFAALIAWVTRQELPSTYRELLEKAHIQRELASSQEQLDMLLFLLTLAHQNGLTDRSVFLFSSMENLTALAPAKRKKLLQELTDLVLTFERWGRLGSAAGLMFDVTPQGLNLLNNEGLFQKFRAHTLTYLSTGSDSV